MLNGRKRITASLAAMALTGGLALSVSTSTSPAQAEPDIETVQARVKKLLHEAEQASERYNDVKINLDTLNDELTSLKADESRQGDSLDGVRADVRASIITQNQTGSLGPAGKLLSADASGFLDELSTRSTIDSIQGSLLSDYGKELKAYTIRKDQTKDRRDSIATLEKKLTSEKKAADSKLAQAESLLAKLEAEEREAILSRSGSDRAPAMGSISASGRAAVAIKYALAQVGDSYVFGAAGPNAFDCSGLTMMAWGQAGVGLPHSSRAQASGNHVAKSDLKPGDLVFYYSPISHVGIYLGNGLIVHAANPGAGVKVSDVNEMPYSGAVRPG